MPVSWLDGLFAITLSLLWHNFVIISSIGEKLHFHAPIGALVLHKCDNFSKTHMQTDSSNSSMFVNVCMHIRPCKMYCMYICCLLKYSVHIT